MMSLFCLLFLFIGQSLASFSSNQYMDTVIHTMLPDILHNEGMTTISLPDYTFEYTRKTIFGKVSGKAEYFDGTLVGLSTVNRYSDCQGPSNTSSGTTINCTLSFGNLDTFYKGKAKYGILPTVNFHAKGSLPSTLINVNITKPLDQKARVTGFSFRTVWGMRTEFSGLGPLNIKMNSWLGNNYKNRVTSEILNVISTKFRNVLEMAAADVPMPLH